MVLKSKNKMLTVADVMSKNILFCKPETSLFEAANMMGNRNVSAIFIMSNDKLIGVWTEADCSKLDFSMAHFSEQPIANFMSSPVKQVHTKTAVSELTILFHNYGFRHLLVVDEKNSPKGVVSLSDVIKSQGLEHYLHFRQVDKSYNPNIPILDASDSMTIVAKKMRETRVNAVLIENKTIKQKGIITERDLLNLLRKGVIKESCWEYASWPLLTVKETTSLYKAYQLLEIRKIRHLVVENDKLEMQGVLSLNHIMSDIELAYMTELEVVLEQRDIALKKSQKNLYLAKKIINASLDGIMITDSAGTILQVNPAFTSLTGYEAQEVMGQNPNILSSGKHDEQFYDKMWEVLRRERVWQGEIYNKKKSGELFLEWLTIIEIRENEDEELLYAAIFSDITERKKAEKRITALAYFDELTHLPNRRLFSDRLEMALATANRDQQKLVVMFLDLDHFKQVNDTLGHSIGDLLLQQVGMRLQTYVKAGDTLARLGGDEFTLLLTEVDDVNEILIYATQLISSLEQPFNIQDHEISITTSIGAAVYPDDGLDSDTLLKHADVAMYRSKELGRNSFQLYKPAMNARSLERMVMESKLNKALRNNAFELFYQPKIDASNFKVVGVEALIRWQDIDLGTISPGSFIPLAEELGLIIDLDIWVLNQACKQIKHWLDDGVQFGKVSINISALHLTKGNLVFAVRNALNLWCIPAQLLEIEVTETSFISSMSEAKKVLNALKALDVNIALDDFGTGYSALSYLTQLPIDTLKIDASFIAKIPDEYGNSQIVKAIVALAQSLGLELVAEGVEKEKQLKFLQEIGCNIIQGYFFSKALAASELNQFIVNRKAVFEN
ncbi:EAL domain-containing protein [Pseudoalteromonas denitrificans]|uniref:cyclic-guanylate-specific phosphodiesterase n=1 Tax=Pseudoalteromonas denitrificans DSM 6059 TaxID=1123010 RepID=A0A1I1L7P4_9GAMM|nr:EAL domain-containing protein [Pseudoalteromonas denitrificans]SFC69049.1 diguanylate cyclase/phosphodiesterase with PAS/PAC sensor(s) [Pseudoalteromonas denitrificans DSM 6059]